MVQIIHSSDVCSPQILEGTPLLFNDSMKLYEEPNLFLRHQCYVKGTVRSSVTYNGYAEILADFLAFLEDNLLDDEAEAGDESTVSRDLELWKEVTSDDLAFYRERMLTTPSPHTKRPYADKTINSRVGLVSLFYEWAYRVGKIDHNPVIYELKNSKNNRPSRGNSSRGKNEKNALLLDENKLAPKFFTGKEIVALKKQCDLENTASSKRDKLIIDFLACTGLRRKEIFGLTISKWRTARKSNESELLFVLDISITKGSKLRLIYIPQSIYDQINHYIKIDRQKAVQKGRRLAREKGKLFKASDQIFVNSVETAWAGRAYTLKRCSDRFHELCNKVSIEPRGPHGLRHTFAVNMYRLLNEIGARNVWKTIQVLLGHKHESTTIEIYLDSVSIEEVEISTALEAYYDQNLVIVLEREVA
ncbi:MAG: site-specific integrase [Kangiellaceae bacterium]|nr:site-specific integrase [Kangiellaceae bacterium]